jgi:hypothetical protein
MTWPAETPLRKTEKTPRWNGQMPEIGSARLYHGPIPDARRQNSLTAQLGISEREMGACG